MASQEFNISFIKGYSRDIAIIAMDRINSNDSKIRIFIVRHGQTDHNVARILQGHLDTELNSEGIKQAGLVGSRFSQVPIDAIYSSDLKRCQLTAKTIQEQLAAPLQIEFTPNLRERHMGAIEGMHIDEAVKYAQEHELMSYKCLGESHHHFIERLQAEMDRILEENKHNKNILLVSHGGTIRALLSTLGYTDNVVVYNTSVTTIDFDKQNSNEFNVISVGDTKHLGEGVFKVVDTRVR